MKQLGGPRPFAPLWAGARLSRGTLTLPCCAPLPLVAPFPSLPHTPDALASQCDFVLRSGPPHFTSYANAAHRSSLLTSLFTRLAMASVTAFGRPALPQTPPHPPGSTPLRLLRPAPPTALHSPGSPPARCFSSRALPPAAQPPAPPARRVRSQSPDTPATAPNASPPRGPLSAGQPAAQPSPTAPLPGRARPGKGPTPPVSPP